MECPRTRDPRSILLHVLLVGPTPSEGVGRSGHSGSGGRGGTADAGRWRVDRGNRTGVRKSLPANEIFLLTSPTLVFTFLTLAGKRLRAHDLVRSASVVSQQLARVEDTVHMPGAKRAHKPAGTRAADGTRLAAVRGTSRVAAFGPQQRASRGPAGHLSHSLALSRPPRWRFVTRLRARSSATCWLQSLPR